MLCLVCCCDGGLLVLFPGNFFEEWMFQFVCGCRKFPILINFIYVKLIFLIDGLDLCCFCYVLFVGINFQCPSIWFMHVYTEGFQIKLIRGF